MKLYWGVFKCDCYGLNKRDMDAMFLRSFNDYGLALKYAQRYSTDTAIHLTQREP